MIELKIPIENNIRVLIGEIWVKTEIKFISKIPIHDTLESITIDQLNIRLSKVAYELSGSIEKQIKDLIKEA